MSDKFFVGLDLTSVENNGLQQPVSRVTFLLDDENSITAGDDTGTELLADCPHATQEMANAILAQVKGYRYQMFSAEDAALDPSAELGDGVTAGGIYSVISRLSDDGSGYAGIAAPGEAELEDEFPTGGPLTKEFSRKISSVRSQIIKTAEKITLLVENEVEGLEGKLELTASSLTSQITAANGQISSIKQFVDDITLSVSNGSTSSTITLKSGSATIASQTIQMNGLVTFTGLANGTTTIDGACIRTGLISANRLDLTGSITFSDLSSRVQDDINDAYAMAEDAQTAVNDLDNTVSGWTYRGTTYIDGSKLMTGTVMASQLLGGYVGLLDSREREVGGISIAYTSTGYGIELSSNTGGIRISAYGNIWLDAYYGEFGINDMGIMCGADVIPLSSSQYALGSSAFPWSDVYADNDAIVTSDLTKKKDVSGDLSAYGRFFDALRPIRYRLENGKSGRVHLGLGAQDVERALEEAGLSGMDFGGFVKSPREDGGFDYALRYGEFIPMCIALIQELTARVARLEGRFAS